MRSKQVRIVTEHDGTDQINMRSPKSVRNLNLFNKNSPDAKIPSIIVSSHTKNLKGSPIYPVRQHAAETQRKNSACHTLSKLAKSPSILNKKKTTDSQKALIKQRQINKAPETERSKIDRPQPSKLQQNAENPDIRYTQKNSFETTSVTNASTQQQSEHISPQEAFEEQSMNRVLRSKFMKKPVGHPKMFDAKDGVDSSAEEYEINRLKVENQFIRNLYHKLCVMKEKQKMKFMEQETKLKKQKIQLQEEVTRLKTELSSLRESKKVKIGHLFTHKNFDRQKNRVTKDQCIKEAASYLEQSQIEQVRGNQYYGMKYHADYCSEEPYGRSVEVYAIKKGLKQEEEMQQSTEDATDSFCSLGIQSTGGSQIRF